MATISWKKSKDNDHSEAEDPQSRPNLANRRFRVDTKFEIIIIIQLFVIFGKGLQLGVQIRSNGNTIHHPPDSRQACFCFRQRSGDSCPQDVASSLENEFCLVRSSSQLCSVCPRLWPSESGRRASVLR